MSHLVTKWTRAEELKGQVIKIVSSSSAFDDVTFAYHDTGEIIQNVYRASIEWQPGYHNRVTLWLVIPATPRQPMVHEAIMCDAIVDMQALVYHMPAVGEMELTEEPEERGSEH